MSEDPRERDDGLGLALRAVFPDQRVWLSLSGLGAKPPPRVRVTGRFLVVPTVDRARFLLPVGPRRVTAAAVLAYNALRPPALRAARSAVGVLAWLGATRVARIPVLTASLPSTMDPSEVSLVHHLASELGGSHLYAAVGVPRPDPNYKPTLQLFDAAGAPRGYAKVGWNPATRELVRAERRVLAALARSGPAAGLPYVPRLLTGGAWAGQEVALVAPLPREVRRLPGPEPPRLAEQLAVARIGAGSPRPFGESPYAVRLAAAVGAAGADRAGAPDLCGAVRELVRRERDTTVAFGTWHGDWVPWNLGRLPGGRLAVWDWEHSAPDVPVGFDLAHQGFQTALIRDRVDAGAAAAAAARLVERYGAGLGLAAGQRRLVVDAYLVEMWLRTWRLARAGAGWNPALHPALLAVLAHRLPAPG